MRLKIDIPRDGGRRFVYDAWQPLAVFVLMAVVGITPYLVRTTSYYDGGIMICNANGEAEEVAANYSPLWDIRLFFNVNMPVLGSLSYTEAKLMDACWDFLFGRGGQAITGLVAYRVLRHSLQLYMEDSVLPIPTVTSICCQQGIQAMFLWEFSRAAATRTPRSSPLKRKSRITTTIRYALCIFVCTYVLSFATIASVMTGYIADLEGWIGSKELGQVKIQKLRRADMILLDGDRIGVTDKQYVIQNEATSTDPVWEVLIELYDTCSNVQRIINNATFSDAFSVDPRNSSWKTRTSVVWQCLSGNCSCHLPPNSTSAWWLSTDVTIGGKIIPLGAPTLSLGRLSNITDHLATYTGLGARSWDRDVWPLPNGTVSSYQSITESSECSAQKKYSWGFSSQILLAFCVYTFLYATTLMVLHTEAYWQSRSYRMNQPHSIYSDILAIADALKDKFGADIRSLPARDLEKEISKHPGGVRLQIDGLPPPRGESFRRKELREAMRAGNEEAGIELATLSPTFEIDALESRVMTTGVDISHQPTANAQLRPRSEHRESEDRALSPLLGLEDEISRIHSHYASTDHSALSTLDGDLRSQEI